MHNFIFSKNKIFYYLLFFFIFIENTSELDAQNLSGKIIDNDSIPVEYVNVILLNPVDSALIDGTMSSKSGDFQFSNLSLGLKTLKISCLGYSTKWINFEIISGFTALGNIVIQEDTTLLNEVTITATPPPFLRKGNNLIINVSNSILALSGTAHNIIEKIPGISIENKEITVFGKGSPVIYINNRKLYDNNELQRIHSSEILNMELITNPGAKYDAEGKAVLLIKTKKNNGWAINLSELFKSQKYFYNQKSIDLTYVYKSLSFFASFSHEIDKIYFKTSSIYTTYRDTVWRQLIDMPQIHWDNSRQLSAGIDWSITDKHSVGGQYQLSVGCEKLSANGTENVWLNDFFYDKISTLLTGKYTPKNHLLNAFYIGNFENGFHLDLNVDYMNSNLKMNQNISESSDIENRNFNIFSKVNNFLYAGKLTANYKIKENSNLEWGCEYNQIHSSGFLESSEQYLENNIYNNKETKTSGFASYSNIFGKLNFQLGVRYEFVAMKSIINRNDITEKKYQGIYPNLSLYQSVGQLQMGLELSRKVQRPSFSLLSGNNYYVNRFLIEKGNPYIQNEEIYQMDYLLKYKTFRFTTGYIYKVNPIGYNLETLKNQSSQSFMEFTNYPRYQELNILLTTDFNWKIWKPHITAGLNQPFFTVNHYNRNRTGLFFQFFNDIVLPKQTVFSINFTYKGKNNRYCTVENYGYKTIDIELRKSFLDNKLLICLRGKDMFNWINNKQDIMINNISFLKKMI
ncbi:MAG: outer membrane beta-barrel protein [Candidatus Azobacteroides sp.]|nr:outer membrane beta-barrel protein [Candidatus Azobacteroides sp.]